MGRVVDGPERGRFAECVCLLTIARKLGLTLSQRTPAVLQAFHHPYFVDGSSEVQNLMGAYMKSWIEGQSPSDKQFILNGLSKDSVKNHKNKRKGHESDQEGHGAHGRE